MRSHQPSAAGRRRRHLALAGAWLLALAGCRQAVPTIATEVRPQAPQPVATAATSVPGEAPQAVSFDPPLDATGVDPARTTLSVVFDRPMDRDGWAWVTEDPETAPDIASSSWDATATTNTSQVKLAPGRTYVLWINSPSYLYFRDLAGRTVEPVRWTFSTAAADGAPQPAAASAAPADISPVASH